MIVDSYYHSISCFEHRQLRRDTPAGIDLVAKIGLFIIPQLRTDPRPLNSRDNKYLLPGPHETDIMTKILPALIYNNDHREHINIKFLTTKHNTDQKKLLDSGELARDFVLMCRTPEDDGDNDLIKPPCFASLNFVGTSESYNYKPGPCYMAIDESCMYSRRSPWMELGYLASGKDHVTLANILQEASNRLAAPNLGKVVKYARSVLLPPSPESTGKATQPQDLLISLILPAQDQGTNTIISAKVILPPYQAV